MKTTLAGYEIADILYDGTRTQVYRGVKTDDSKPAILKKLRKEYPTFNELLQFRHQYILTKNLDVPGIVRPIALEKYGNAYVLVMADVGGMSLSEYISDRPLNLDEFFPVAIAISKILEDLYLNRIIHKDIKPANILINPETKEIFLIDFSISSLLPRETQEIQNPNILEGTLAYISPEQTGRMNRGIDYRSDFYSLGVTFYELLTGEMPYHTDDPMELVHCHIAKTPILPHLVKPEIPLALSEIVMKLMAKTAEERYQSAKGIELDLEKCWQQWQETGSITELKLGERDISDRFCLPEKLYGREAEAQTLLDAFKRVSNGTTEIMLVAGFSGIGKTAVINEVHKPIVEKRGYFIKGKFDQFQRNIPFSALVQAFRDLMGQLLSESDAQLETWKTKILNAVGENARVIIDVIPELEEILGKQPAVAELSGSAATNRFNLLFGKFIRVFTTKDHPLVIFVDDLQWADSASLKLMQLLMEDSETGYLLLLGAYRDNEVFPAHPLMLTLSEISQSGAIINTITLAPLSLADLNRLVADTLCCLLELGLPLTELVYQKTKGNPFFATQFLKGLHEDGWIAFDFDIGHWQCDMTEVRELALSDDVVEFMATRLHKLPESTREILKLAACIGNNFDLGTLAIVSEQSQLEVATNLWVALQEGLVLPLGETYKFFQEANQEEKTSEDISVGYKFLHDRVQQAAYSSIAEETKQNTHLYIGTLLVEKLSASEREERIFEIVNHLNIGKASIAELSQKEELIRLNLSAGRKAKAATAYAGSLSHIQVGIELLPNDCWERDYDLSFALYKERAEIEYLNGNVETAEIWVERTLKQAKTAMEKAKVYNISIVQYTLQAKYTEAIEAGRQGLALMGIELPQEDFETVRDAELAIATETLKGRSFASLVELPFMSEPEKQMAIQLLITLGPPTYRSHQRLWSVICAKAVNLCLNYGNTPEVGYIYPAFGGLRGYVLNNYQGTDELLNAAIQLTQAFNNKSAESVAYLMIGSSLRHWSHPLKVATEDYLSSYRVGLESSNLQYAAYAFGHNMYCRFYQGVPLEKLLKEVSESLAFGRKYKNQWAIDLFIGGRAIFSELMGTSTDSPQLLVSIDESDYLEQCRLHKNWQVICIYNILKTQQLFIFERFDEALEYGRQADAEIINVAPQGLLPYPRHLFIYSLLLASLYSQASQAEQIEYLKKISTYQKQLEIWAQNCPENFLHLYCLVKAEVGRISGEFLEAIELYDRAIAAAKENEYIQEEALANELAAKFYLHWGKEKFAGIYMQEAYYCYARWGAKAKIDRLEKGYPQLLAPILEPQHLGSIASGRIATMTKGTLSKTTTGRGEFLDLATLMKASRTLSQDISLEGAIANLMQVAMENAGAETAALMLFEEQVLMLTALVTGEGVQKIDSIPVETSNAVPLSIVNKVKHKQKPLVLDNASNETAYAGDAYILSSQPKSILCLPLVDRGKLIGILYLENNRVAGAFMGDRVEVLSLLCSQAAISLENAQLYQESLNYAQQLEQTQLQLVQSEKMASIGELTAGVAHEINNPVGFISGNLTYTSDYFQDLIRLLNLYRQTFPQPGEEIEEEMEVMELDYLIEDLPQTIDSMKEGIERITEISKSMRTFSRGDTATKVAFNLHDGIDSTLLILKHRLKASVSRPEIEVVKNYGNLPEINCYPGQLNQVFMNLIANAIDAFDEGNVGRSFDEIKAAPNRITITTEIEDKKQVALVKIKDNGMGMSNQVKEKVFEHLFTTKGVGKGTGLGLSISRQIVEEKHGGKITLISAEGKGTQFAIALPLI